MTTATALAAGRHTLVAQRCTVRFVARSLGLAVPGEISVRSGEVEVDDTGAAVSAELDAASFRTRSARRDRDVRSPRFLDVERTPRILVSGRWGGPGTPLYAELTVKEVTAPVEIVIVDIDRTPGGAVVHARGRVDRRAHPVGPVQGPIGRWVDVEMRIVLLPSVLPPS